MGQLCSWGNCWRLTALPAAGAMNLSLQSYLGGLSQGPSHEWKKSVRAFTKSVAWLARKGNDCIFKSVPWVSDMTEEYEAAKDAWCMSMHSKEAGGRQCQAKLCSSAGRVTITKSWSHLLTEGWGAVIVEKRAETYYLCLISLWCS